jgi:hypothetical protein
LRTTINPDESYLLDSLQKNQLGEFFESALVFNRQSVVITLEDFQKEAHLNKRLQVVATLKSSNGVVENEVVAIIEGIDIPVYIVTYNIEFQFVFELPVDQ